MTGKEKLLNTLATSSSVARDGASTGRVRFVEDKIPDWADIERITRQSVKAGRWANLGPVQEQLSELVARVLRLDDSHPVVTSSSATSALHALTGAYAEQAGRPLVWAVSAFGFISTAIGPLAHRVRIVDCDRSGLLSLAELKSLPEADWDGLIVTDLFGMRPDLSSFAHFCEQAGKPMIVDSALSFPAHRAHGLGASEILSFHHTKPWGFGEGGCAIARTVRPETVRAFLNFGVGANPSFAEFASNGKMSDVSAALILQRVQAMPEWQQQYIHQGQRVAGLAVEAGLEVLVRPADSAATQSVPLLARRPVTLTELPAMPFDAAKYYKPLSTDCPVATDLYARIINVPCHPGMKNVTDESLRELFNFMAQRND